MLPATCVDDGLLAPHTRGAVEVEEATRTVSRDVLDDEVAVQHHRLTLRQHRILFVDMAPACLDHADVGIGEVIHQLPQHVAMRHEVRIEDHDQVSFGALEAGLERTGFESGAIRTVQILNVEAQLDQLVHFGAGDLLRLVGGVVENLQL